VAPVDVAGEAVVAIPGGDAAKEIEFDLLRRRERRLRTRAQQEH
jgi:hypothetical protein